MSTLVTDDRGVKEREAMKTKMSARKVRRMYLGLGGPGT
jgi:hypothetical protein